MKGKLLLFHMFKQKQSYTHFAQNDPKLWPEWPPTVYSSPSHAKIIFMIRTDCGLPSSPQPHWRFYAATTTSLSIQTRWLHQPCRSQPDLLINPGMGSFPSLECCSHNFPQPQLAWPRLQGLLGVGVCPSTAPAWQPLTVLSPWLGVGPGFGNRSCFWRSRNSRFWLCLRHVWLSAITAKALVNTRGWAQSKVVRMATANEGIK